MSDKESKLRRLPKVGYEFSLLIISCHSRSSASFKFYRAITVWRDLAGYILAMLAVSSIRFGFKDVFKISRIPRSERWKMSFAFARLLVYLWLYITHLFVDLVIFQRNWEYWRYKLLLKQKPSVPWCFWPKNGLSFRGCHENR